MQPLAAVSTLPRGPRLPPGWLRESRDGNVLLHPDHPTWCAVNDFGLETARLADGSRSIGELYRVLDQLAESDGASVALSGGEPLVHRDLPQILEYAVGKAPVEGVIASTLALVPKENIYPCQLFRHPDDRVGNLHEMSLQEATESPELLRMIRAAVSRKYVVEDCRTCNWRSFCQGNCSASAHWQKGTLWAESRT